MRVIGSDKSQIVTGICVNEKLQVPKRYRKNIRQEIYYIKKFGIDAHLKHIGYDESIEHYLRVLYGRILFVLSINKKDSQMKSYREFLKDNFIF